ncbi:hypothetical protein ACTXT7_004112 [Hymenolepis weldensis]
MTEELKPLPHHRKVGPCLTRPPYRDGKRKKAVKVFTIADESMYVLIFGVPSIDLLELLTERLQQISPVQSIRKVDYPDPEAFTDTYLVKFGTVNSARNVKRRLDDTSFYGGILHIVYAPEYESVSECRIKMHTYRKINDAVTKKAAAEKQREIKDYNQLSEESLQIPNVQQPSTFTSIPSALATGVIGNTSAFSNPYSMPLPIPSSSQFNALQSGDAAKAAGHFWTSRGFRAPPVVSTNDTQPLTQFISNPRYSHWNCDSQFIATINAQPLFFLDLNLPYRISILQYCAAPKFAFQTLM